MQIAYDEHVGVDRGTGAAACYEELIEAWNGRDADRFAAAFADDGVVIGFDGSEQVGRAAIGEELGRIFEDHETATYVTKVRSVRLVRDDVALLQAVCGMIPPGGSDLLPERHARQTVLAAREADEWRIALFQNTPAQLHGRADLVERLTDELREVARRERGDQMGLRGTPPGQCSAGIGA